MPRRVPSALRLPRLLAVLLVLGLPGGLAACGGDDMGSKSARDVLSETFGPDKPVRSGKLDLTVAVKAAGTSTLGGPLRLQLEGPFSAKGKGALPIFDFDVDLNAGGQAIRAGAVSTGSQGFLKFGGQTFDLGTTSYARLKKLYEQDQGRTKKQETTTLQALGVDPGRWLEAPRKVGDADVGGTETVHVTSAVDVAALVADIDKLLRRAGSSGASAAAGAAAGTKVPTGLTAAQRAAITQSVKAASVDVFSGKSDGTLRRLTLNVRFDVPAAQRASAGGLTQGSIGVDLVLTDLNEPQTVEAPKGARPISELLSAFAPTGTTGATTAPPTGATGAAPAAGSPEAKYSQCLSDAGADLAKVQACAPLLNGG